MKATADEQDDITATEFAEFALQDLARELIDDDLRGGLAALNGPLEKKHANQTAQARTLRESHQQLQERVAARKRVLAVEIDRALSEGRDDDAEAHRQEGAGLEQSLKDILAQAEACEARAGELAVEMSRNYRAVFERVYPEITQSVIAAEIALLKMLDAVKAGLIQYESKSRLSLLTNQHFLDLTPRDYGPEKRYFESLRRWFGGRQ